MIEYVYVFSIDKPLPQIATGDVISVIALLLAAGVLMGITITVLVLKIRSRKDNSYVNSPLSFCFSDTFQTLFFRPSFFALFSLIRRDSPSRKLSQPVRKRPGDDIQVTNVLFICKIRPQISTAYNVCSYVS